MTHEKSFLDSCFNILAILVGPKAYEYLFNSGKDVGESIGHELNKNMNNN